MESIIYEFTADRQLRLVLMTPDAQGDECPTLIPDYIVLEAGETIRLVRVIPEGR